MFQGVRKRCVPNVYGSAVLQMLHIKVPICQLKGGLLVIAEAHVAGTACSVNVYPISLPRRSETLYRASRANQLVGNCRSLD